MLEPDKPMSWFVLFGYTPAQTTPFNGLQVKQTLERPRPVGTERKNRDDFFDLEKSGIYLSGRCNEF